MRFEEKRVKKGIRYKVDEPFGIITFISKNQIMNLELLDDIFMAIYGIKTNNKILKGFVELNEKVAKITGQDKINYKYIRKFKNWDDVLGDKEIKFISKIIDFDLLTRKELDIVSLGYGDLGYELNDEFKKLLISIKKNHEKENKGNNRKSL